MTSRKLVLLSGPTASGKTSLSYKLQKEFSFSLCNFDSLLFYKELNIGTAKPSVDELRKFPLELINMRSLFDKPMNASTYCDEAVPLIDKLHSEDKVPLLVGGSGFYLRALIKGMYPSETVTDEVKKKISLINDPFQKLKEVDPIAHAKLHGNDSYRIQRALEHYFSTGKAFSKAEEERIDRYKQKGWQLFHIHLNPDKESAWKQICLRTEEMLKQGLIEEVKQLLEAGATGDEKPLQSVGYKETISFLRSSETDLKALSERISISTRQLAKAQRTWFQKVQGMHIIPSPDHSDRIILQLRDFLSRN